MGLNRKLIDTIKGHFGQKSSAQLQEIVRLKDLDRWSEEAIVAAREVLLDRASGDAKEPRVPVEDPPPPPPSADVFGSFAFFAGIGSALALGTGFLLLPGDEAPAEDRPVAFGSNIAWLAVETTDTAAVAAALGLRSIRAWERPLREATWEEGVAAAYRSSVFVTPPLGDWTLAVGTALLPPERIEAFVKPLLEQLSRQFGDAQYFCTHRDVELHAWARAKQGRFRGYGWLGQQRRTLWNEGPLTKEERSLGFRFTDGSSAPAEKGVAENPLTPDEGCVMQLAALWSIDPTSLDEYFQEPVMGLLGDIHRRQGGTS